MDANYASWFETKTFSDFCAKSPHYNVPTLPHQTTSHHMHHIILHITRLNNERYLKNKLLNKGIRIEMMLFFILIAVVALGNNMGDSVFSNYFKRGL